MPKLIKIEIESLGPQPFLLRKMDEGCAVQRCAVCDRKRVRSYTFLDAKFNQHHLCYKCVRESHLPHFVKREEFDHRRILRSRYQKNKILTS